MKVVVLGSGESAVGAALLAAKKHYTVFVSDNSSIATDTKHLLQQHNIHFEENGHSIDIIGKADLIIKSPGIPNSSDLITRLHALEKEVIGEIEFGYRYCESKIIGITGSNGKSTVTSMIHHILESAGMSVSIGGNFGTSFCRLLCDAKTEYYVLELSSFQLEDIVDFKPDVALILNITPDHLDRYQYDINLYADAKFRICKNQVASDKLIYNTDDSLVKEKTQDVLSTLIGIAQHTGESTLAQLMVLDELPFRGGHNYFNCLVALEAAQAVGVDVQDGLVSMKHYKGLPHRMEEVAIVNGVKYINDSKATNVDAVYYALDGLDGPLIWIVGGVDKGNDYSQLDKLVAEKVTHIICMGTNNTKLIEYYSGKEVSLSDCSCFEAAMEKVVEIAEVGDTVLLSPACASFDLFDNYIHRGNIFKERIYTLIYNSYSCLQ